MHASSDPENLVTRTPRKRNQIGFNDSPEKPRVFVGSSKEGLELAGAIQVQLASIADCTVWNQGIFELGKTALSNLYNF
jgi:predicted nucleotide-binding protein